MKELNKQEVLDLFESLEKKGYQKKGRFLYRPTIEGETILTIVDGKLETMKKSCGNEAVIRNIEIGSSAETYIIEKNIFEKRYELTEETHIIDRQCWNVVIAKGKIEASIYAGDTIKFMAPWNELMICNSGDSIARPLSGDKNDIYRIEQKTFELTYVEIP